MAKIVKVMDSKVYSNQNNNYKLGGNNKWLLYN